MFCIDSLLKITSSMFWRACKNQDTKGKFSNGWKFEWRPSVMEFSLHTDKGTQNIKLIRKASNIKRLSNTSYLCFQDDNGRACFTLYYYNGKFYPRSAFRVQRYKVQNESRQERFIRLYNKATDSEKAFYNYPKYSKRIYNGKVTRRFKQIKKYSDRCEEMELQFIDRVSRMFRK